MAADVGHLRDLPEDTVAEVEAKRAKFAAWVVDPKRTATQRACDLQVAAFLLPKIDSGDVFGRPLVPTTATVRQVLSGKPVNDDLIDTGVAAADAVSTLHWPLAFPEVMIGRGGFDVVLGNPPWEVMQLGEEEYFASRDPDIAAMKGAQRKKAIAALAESDPALFEAYERDKRAFESANEFARSSGRFDLTARGKVNTYALFAEHFSNLMHENGRAGVIVPSGIMTDFTTSRFFSHLVSSNRLVSSLGFDNAKRIFPAVHPDTPFTLLTMGYSTRAPEFTSYILTSDELKDERRHYFLSSREISRINPNTKTAPVFRSQRDAELTAGIYDRVPVLIEEGVDGGNPWGVEFRQGLFNMTSDSGLFSTAAQLAAEGFVCEGTDWVKEKAMAVDATTVIAPRQSSLALAGGRDAEHLDLSTGGPNQRSIERFVPLYEAKMIHQFDHRWATYDGEEGRDVALSEKQDAAFEPLPRYWVPEREVSARLADKGWTRDWLVGWRDITNATNERRDCQ